MPRNWQFYESLIVGAAVFAWAFWAAVEFGYHG